EPFLDGVPEDVLGSPAHVRELLRARVALPHDGVDAADEVAVAAPRPALLIRHPAHRERHRRREDDERDRAEDGAAGRGDGRHAEPGDGACSRPKHRRPETHLVDVEHAVMHVAGCGPRKAALYYERPTCAAREGTPVTIYDRPFGRYFEDFEVGDVYRHWPGKTITEYDDHLFCMITMNHHPLHTNAQYARDSTQFGRNVVVGNLVYSLALGMSVPDVSGKAIAN